MGQCANCHHEQLKHRSVCPNCHCQILYSKQPVRKSHDSDTTQAFSSRTHKRPPSLKKAIPIAIVSFIIVLLIILFLLLRNFNSPEAQAKLLINAVNHEDTAKVSNLLSSKENKVGRNEAATYIQFIKKEVGMDHFHQEVYQTVDRLNHETAVASYIKTKQGQNVLRISKNGRRYFIFDNLSFSAPTKQAVVKAKENATYQFESNGSQKKVVAEKGQTVALGAFIPGRYEIDATKTTDRGTYEGQLKFDFTDNKNDTATVTESFKAAQVKVTLKNGDKLNDVKIVINGEQIVQSKNELYAPFPLNKALTISAEGQLADHTLKTEEKVINKDEVQPENEVTLSFDSDEVDKYQKVKEQNTLDKVAEFFKKYTSALNEAYQKRNFDIVSHFFKEDSTHNQALKANINGQNTYQIKNAEVIDVSRNNGDYVVTVEKEDNQGRTVQSHYILDGDENADKLQILNYQDDI
ncbi:TcaA NTF2-like domain-containing protein [Staphylococcus lutrae]|uniref:Membrane-associated protein n=1 Tax=Staphylococcus lutrae TaxID=155085 RepID=A0AAC9RTJ7_9STAP|nr:teicoplanin resistance protein VanZ [Staphylococcus lutrae]ARJ50510.1 teicoplanin resistance protein VanZ [Staphylococcus lutrae]PNZ37411.1 teicoplanin resistance protein VanZ [Staphylococcus lutrae]